MKLNILKQFIADFKSQLNSLNLDAYEHHWEAWDYFQQHWDVEELDFYTMYQNSFQSKKSLRLWKRENFYPKEIMLRFIETDKEFVRIMFYEILKGKSDLNIRVSRFLHYCNEMIKSIQKKDKKADQHYHQDYEMIFTYLTFTKPDTYSLLDVDLFNKFMTRLEAKNLPRAFEPEYYERMVTVIRKFLFEDEEFMEALEQKVNYMNLKHFHPSFFINPFMAFSVDL